MNLNGDYVSDMLAAQVGGIGISPGANINYEAGRAIFEATHGTAPDLAGKNQANPCSIILSAVMMLDHMGWHEAANKVTQAIESTFGQGYATADLARFMDQGKPLGTKEFATALCQEMEGVILLIPPPLTHSLFYILVGYLLSFLICFF